MSYTRATVGGRFGSTVIVLPLGRHHVAFRPKKQNTLYIRVLAIHNWNPLARDRSKAAGNIMTGSPTKTHKTVIVLPYNTEQ